MTKIKICGLSRETDIAAANEIKPDYIGFVFFPKSRHYVSPERAQELKWQLDSSIKAVGVFVDEDIELVSRLLKDGAIDIAQLHGNEDEEYIRKLKELTGKSVIKAVSVKREEDILKWAQTRADYILLDHGAGGTGKSFDWALIPKLPRPWFLAGGLGLDNLDEALKQGADVLDISSGAERDGYKDPVKMSELVSRVRQNGKN